jgi:hypothetical protein
MNRIANLIPRGANVYSRNPVAAVLTNPTELARSLGTISHPYPLYSTDGRLFLDVDTAYIDTLKPRFTQPYDDRMVNGMARLNAAKFRSNPELLEMVEASAGQAGLDPESFLRSLRHEVVGNKFWETPSRKAPDGMSGAIEALARGYGMARQNPDLSLPSGKVISVHLPQPQHPVNRAKQKPLGVDEGVADWIANRDPEGLILFGDNYIGKGKAGQAIIRDKDIAVGIPTKKLPAMSPDSFLYDEDLDEYIRRVSPTIERLQQHLDRGGRLYFLSTGIGTGLAVARNGRSQKRVGDWLANRLYELGVPESIIGNPLGGSLSRQPVVASHVVSFASPKMESNSVNRTANISIPEWNPEPYLSGGKVLMGTGHRPDKLGGYDIYPSTLNKLTDLAGNYLEELEPDRVVSGMAQGWDSALAIAAIRKGIPLTAAVAFDGVEKRWTPDAQRLFHRILDKSDNVRVVGNTGSGRSAGQLLNDRNLWMIDNSSGVLALWNGTSGGTANAVRDAIGRDKPILNLWDEWRGKPTPIVANPIAPTPTDSRPGFGNWQVTYYGKPK